MAEEFLEFLHIPTPPSPTYQTTLSSTDTSKDTSKIPFQRPLSPTPESKCNIYSAPHDSNWPPTLDEGRFDNVEDSILTNLRRTNPDKILKLEKRMREPEQDLRSQFDLLRTLLTRVTSDCEQIIFNFVEDNMNKVENRTKRVKLTTL